MFPDAGSTYGNYNWGYLIQQLGQLGGQIANGFSNPPAAYSPTLYPFAGYNGFGANPYPINPFTPNNYSPGYTSPISYGTPALFDKTYNMSPFAGSSGLLIMGGIILILVVALRA